jgi:hypothetical protein
MATVQKLVELRGNRSQADIARAMRLDGDLKVEIHNIRAWEEGSVPSGLRFNGYAAALGIKPDDLVTIYKEHRAAPAA